MNRLVEYAGSLEERNPRDDVDDGDFDVDDDDPRCQARVAVPRNRGF